MRYRYASALLVLMIAAAAALAAVTAGPANASPSQTRACNGCHSGAASGTVTATPSTTASAAGAAYTVAVNIGLASSGNTGYHIASTDAAGMATSFVAVYAGPAAQTTWTASMTAPATPGTYYYQVWCVKGPASSAGQTKVAAYSITVPAAPAAGPVLTSLAPASGPVGTMFTISGTSLGTSGAVTVGGVSAATGAWSATSITCTAPAGLALGSRSVVVTPSGGAASNALAFTVDAQPVAADMKAPTTSAAAPVAGVWCNDVVTVTLTAADSGGSGVASITYRADGGTLVAVHASSVDVPVGVPRTASGVGGARAVDGVHTVEFYATDLAGNQEAVRSVAVNIDSRSPATRAPSAARAKQRREAALRYEVRDATPNAGTADVEITIKDRRGKVVKRLRLDSRPVNTALTAKFRCALRPGTYRFSVRATDAAGNPQANVASQRLTVM